MCDRIEDMGAAIDAACEVVLEAVADRKIEDGELIKIGRALLTCGAAQRELQVDGQHVTAAIAMIGTLARTLELTPKVTRKLHEQERDLVAVEAASLAYINNIEELFPLEAA